MGETDRSLGSNGWIQSFSEEAKEENIPRLAQISVFYIAAYEWSLENLHQCGFLKVSRNNVDVGYLSLCSTKTLTDTYFKQVTVYQRMNSAPMCMYEGLKPGPFTSLWAWE